MKKSLYLIVIILIFSIVFGELSAAVRYVTTTGIGSGTSWADASSDLQLIINNSSSGDEIWVANGTYKPNRRADNLGVINMGDRYNAFVLKSDVKIYGGFAGTETSLSQRNWISNVTILSGDIGAAGDNIDNAYHVVVSAGAVGTAELNGFTITGGNSNGDVTSITVNLKAVTRESAGGIYCSNSSPILTNLIISNNYANFGGGIYNSFSSPIITKSTIKNNTAGTSGGGICNTGFDSTTKSSPIFKNVLIYGNTATTNGGGIFDDSYTNTNFVNITLTKNSVTNGAGGGYYNFTSVKATPIIQNSIIWGNIKASAVNNVSTNATTVYNYSLVQGGNVNMTNIISNYDPQFTDSIANNFTLKAGSPAINAGFNSYISDVSSDLLEKSRVYNGLVDLGVYESEIAPTPIQIFGANLIADTTGFYNLRSLFVALWAYGSQLGKDIVVKINASTDETTPAYPTLSSRSWKSLTFYPTVSGCVIRGLSQGSIFALNGVNNVILDGRVNQTGNTADLTLINTASNPGAITVKFTGAAHHNIVKYCNLIGNDKNSNYGVVVFSGFNINTPSEGGNYNNTVSNCNITSYDSTRLRNAIYSDALFGYANRTNSIIDNNIYNFTSNSDTVCGICINGYSTDFTITGNSIYETDPVIYTRNIPRLYGIFINTAENGNNFTISGNYIGGTQTHCGGAPLAFSGKDGKYSEVIFKPIFLNVGSTTASSVQGNFIQNINNSNTSAPIPFIGIHAASGKINIGTVIGNTIGSALANGNIRVSTNNLLSGSVNATSYGVFIDSPFDVNCQNNTISGITTNTVNAVLFPCSSNIIGIYKSGNAGATVINSNTIGSTTIANSLYASSVSAEVNQSVYGIYSSATSGTTITGNTIANLTNGTTNSTASARGVVNGITATTACSITNNSIHHLTIGNANDATTNQAAVCGIALSGATINTVTGNTLYSLSNSYNSFTGSVIGLYYTGDLSGNTVSRNFIHSLSVTGASSNTAIVFGV